jgi:uncharacterized protein (TIGR01777 family)
MRVFVTGATGLIGTRVTRKLLDRGDTPVVLTRRPEAAREKFASPAEVVKGDPVQRGEWMDAVDSCDAVIHLAGENVFARRWGAEFKKLLRDSRIFSTRHVVEALKSKPLRDDGQPRVLINASAIGYYGPHDDEELTEDSPPGQDFLAQLCVDWEKEALSVLGAGVRCVTVRVGVVLDREGGALAKMLTPFKLFVGGKVAGGRQWMSWIHHEDMAGIFLHPLDNPGVTGALNGTAPNPVTNKTFSKALGRALHRPSIFPTPGFMLRLMLGEVASVVTTGQKVIPRRTLDSGYNYKFTDLDLALQDIVGK